MSDPKIVDLHLLEERHPWVVMWLLMSLGVLLSWYLDQIIGGLLSKWYPTGLEVYASVIIGLIVAIAYTAAGKFKPPTKSNMVRRRAVAILAGMGWEAWVDRIL